MSKVANSEMNRLRTFEIDEDEQLLVAAGRGEMDQRIIFRGSAPGRYAIVPIEEINQHWEAPKHTDQLDVEGLEIMGDSAEITPGEESTLSLLQDETVVEQSALPGIYGLMRIPFQQK